MSVGTTVSTTTMPATISSTNATAASGVLYAAAKPAAVPAAISTRRSSADRRSRVLTAYPAVPPNWISGPSRPSEPPHTIAHHDATDLTTVTTTDSLPRPSATASITSLTPPPPRFAISSVIAPAASAPTIGSTSRHGHEAALIAATILVTPAIACVTPASDARNAIAKAPAASATST